MDKREVFQRLLNTVKDVYGEEVVEDLLEDTKSATARALHREIYSQFLARLPFLDRWRFLVLYPEFLLGYLLRIRVTKTAD